MFDKTVWVRGAGEMGSATAQILHGVGFRVYVSELPLPLAIRRKVTFSDAILTGQADVEGTRGIFSETDNANKIISNGSVSVLLDNQNLVQKISTDILVDARMLKRETVNLIGTTELTIGLGPGFNAQHNCDIAIETNRGHNLGRIITRGGTDKDTGVPGVLGGESNRRVIYSSGKGTIKWLVDFGDIVEKGTLLGTIADTTDIHAPLSGIVRGLISPGVQAVDGMKIGDVDPRGKKVEYLLVSDKARLIGRGVLEAILKYYHKKEKLED